MSSYSSTYISFIACYEKNQVSTDQEEGKEGKGRGKRRGGGERRGGRSMRNKALLDVPPQKSTQILLSIDAEVG